MRRDKINIGIGIIILLILFSGFTHDVKTIIISICALAIIIISLQEVRKEHKRKIPYANPPDAYVESKPRRTPEEAVEDKGLIIEETYTYKHTQNSDADFHEVKVFQHAPSLNISKKPRAYHKRAAKEIHNEQPDNNSNTVNE